MDRPAKVRSRWRLLVLGLAVAASVAITSFVPGPQRFSASARALQSHAGKARDAYLAGRFEEAADHFRQMTQIRRFDPILHFNMACCLARAGKVDDTITALQRAIEYGWEDSEAIARSSTFAPIRGDPRLERIIRDADACLDENVVVYAGKSVDPAKPAPLLVILHGMSDTPRFVIPGWKKAADELGLVIAVPKGVTQIALSEYAWSPAWPVSSELNWEAARRSIQRAVEMAEADHTIDRSRIVLAGISQGGELALRMMHDYPDRYAGVVTLITVYHPAAAGHWKGVPPKRAYFIAGELDRARPMSAQACEELRACGHQARYEEVPGMGHEMPPDLESREIRALKYVLGGN